MTNNEKILLIGYGGNKKHIGEIYEINSYLDFCKEFDSTTKLANGVKTLEDFECNGIYIMNLNKEDINSYIDAADIIKQHDFVYIVPTDIYIGNSYYDTTTCSNIHLLNYIAKQMYDCNKSIVIGTDKHASLYEDIDNFISDMNDVESNIRIYDGTYNYGESLIFVANNLKNYELANVVLAAALLTSNINEYPTTDKFGNAIFDIDINDIKEHSMVYFRGHDDRDTTIENLLNLNLKIEPKKIVVIDRIFKYILRDMDFSEFEGRLYEKHILIQVRKKLTRYMEYYKGFLLIDYSIDSINFYKNGPSVGTIVCTLTVIPIGCFEECNLEIKIGK